MRENDEKPSAASRRDLLKAGAGLAAIGSVAFAGKASAQGDELARLQGARRILIKGGVVLTLDKQAGDFPNADVLIEDGKIREVKPNVAASDAVVVDAAHRIVMPGFIDTHHHFYQGILRNILSNGLLNPDYNRDVSNALTAPYLAADVYAGTLISALGMIDMGTTTAVDTSQVNHTPEHSDAGIRALQESGLRAVYAYSRGAGPGSQYPQDISRLRRTYFTSDDQLLTLALATSLDQRLFTFAREFGVRIVSHGVSNATEQTLMTLGRAGLMLEGHEYIHCTQLSADAWRMIKDTGGLVSLSPPIEMAMGHGMPGIQEALDHGLRPSLSSDVDVTMAQDPFTVMRAAFTLQRLNVLQRARRGEQNLPPLITTRQVLEMNVLNGAHVTMLEDKIGTLVPGKDADIVLLKADGFNVWPLNNVPGAVVNLMNPGNVDSVFIAGKVKKWRGGLAGVDVARVLRLAAEARDGVIKRANFQTNLFS